MCIFRADNRIVCRSVPVTDNISFNIVKDHGTLTVYVQIEGKITSMVVVSEDSAKIWVQQEIYRELKTWIVL